MDSGLSHRSRSRAAWPRTPPPRPKPSSIVYCESRTPNPAPSSAPRGIPKSKYGFGSLYGHAVEEESESGFRSSSFDEDDTFVAKQRLQEKDKEIHAAFFTKYKKPPPIGQFDRGSHGDAPPINQVEPIRREISIRNVEVRPSCEIIVKPHRPTSSGCDSSKPDMQSGPTIRLLHSYKTLPNNRKPNPDSTFRSQHVHYFDQRNGDPVTSHPDKRQPNTLSVKRNCRGKDKQSKSSKSRESNKNHPDAGSRNGFHDHPVHTSSPMLPPRRYRLDGADMDYIKPPKTYSQTLDVNQNQSDWHIKSESMDSGYQSSHNTSASTELSQRSTFHARISYPDSNSNNNAPPSCVRNTESLPQMESEEYRYIPYSKSSSPLNHNKATPGAGVSNHGNTSTHPSSKSCSGSNPVITDNPGVSGETIDKCLEEGLLDTRPSDVWSEHNDWESIVKTQYIGSFSVVGQDQASRTEYVRKQLTEMRNVTKTKPVLLVVSLSGVKVCSSSGESVYMAHALKRISYATCDPEYCQFSFLAREPKGHTNIQYCHAFVANSAEEAEELNTIVGNAFKLAYAHQRQKQEVAPPEPEPEEEEMQDNVSMVTYPIDSPQRQPTFNELIEQQIEQQREQFVEQQRQQQVDLEKRLSAISTAKIEERRKELKERRQKEVEEVDKEKEQSKMVAEQTRLQGKERTSWAKMNAGRSRHKLPLLDDGTQAQASQEPPATPPTPPQSTSARSNPPLVAAAPAPAPPAPAAAPAAAPALPVLGLQNNDIPLTKTSASPFASISALRDAFNSGELRSYGSPVMTLKETIDRIPLNGQFSIGEDINRFYKSSVSGAAATNRDRDSVDASPDMNSRPNGKTKQKEETVPLSRPNPGTTENGHRRSKGKGHTKVNTQRSPPQDQPSPPQQHRQQQQQQHQISPIQNASSPTVEPNFYDDHTYGNTDFVDAPNGTSRHELGQSVGALRPLSGRYSNGSPADSDVGVKEPVEENFEDGDAYNGPPTPLRFDSLHKLDPQDLPFEEELRNSSWYQAGIPREIALEILGQEEIGAFIVRDSNSYKGCYALSVKVPKYGNPSGISHYLIMRTPRNTVKLKGVDKEWPTLTALVTHHTVMPEMLPCTLRLPRNSNNPTFHDTDRDDRDEEEDYQRLSDFNAMMADLRT